MLEILFTIILTPIAFLSGMFTVALGVGLVKGTINSFKKLKK